MQNLGQIAVRGAQLFDQIRDRKAGGLAIERPHRVAMLALPLRHLMHHRRHLALDRRDLTLDTFVFGLRKLRELLL